MAELNTAQAWILPYWVVGKLT